MQTDEDEVTVIFDLVIDRVAPLDYGQEFMPTLFTYLIFGGVLTVPYMVWSKRQLKK